MTAENTIEVLKALPALLWVGLAITAFVLLYKPLKDDLIRNITAFKGFGIEVTLRQAQSTLEHINLHRELAVSPNDLKQVLRRTSRASRILKELSVLWVDDHPKNNEEEVKLFREFGIHVRCVETTEEALKAFETMSYDAVISDMERGGDSEAGTKLAKQLLDCRRDACVVVYLTKMDFGRETPPHIFGLTNRPDHLLHYLIDIAERNFC